MANLCVAGVVTVIAGGGCPCLQAASASAATTSLDPQPAAVIDLFSTASTSAEGRRWIGAREVLRDRQMPRPQRTSMRKNASVEGEVVRGAPPRFPRWLQESRRGGGR